MPSNKVSLISPAISLFENRLDARIPSEMTRGNLSVIADCARSTHSVVVGGRCDVATPGLNGTRRCCHVSPPRSFLPSFTSLFLFPFRSPEDCDTVVVAAAGPSAADQYVNCLTLYTIQQVSDVRCCMRLV